MFSTFVDTIQSQAMQIQEMQENAERADQLIENMTQSVRMMEMNIHGFASLPAADDDHSTLRASRRASIAVSRRASVHQHHHMNQQPTENLIGNAVKSLPEPTNTERSSTTPTSPRTQGERPNEWEESPDKKTTEDVTSTSEDKEKDSTQPPPKEKDTAHHPKSHQKQRKNTGRKDASWKYKKRRIIRQVSLKMKEVAEDEQEVEDGTEDKETANEEESSIRPAHENNHEQITAALKTVDKKKGQLEMEEDLGVQQHDEQQQDKVQDAVSLQDEDQEEDVLRIKSTASNSNEFGSKDSKEVSAQDVYDVLPIRKTSSTPSYRNRSTG